MIRNILDGSPARIGMVLFKDYYDEYLTKIIPFTTDMNQIQRTLNGITARGGGDIPEAVYEALYDGAVKFSWEAETRLIILVGDAPPHLRQRGRISEEMVKAAAAERGIKVHAIILPQ
jgi:Mg-chelatase subunit ChlD